MGNILILSSLYLFIHILCGHKGVEVSRTPIVMKSGEWVLKVVPWIGGRIISMEHVMTSLQVEVSVYEEYSGTYYQSAGCQVPRSTMLLSELNE
ncbi:unnamed protein product [Coffea canephora]|uniref:Uncharacterized protein n=1 Tax=Coffea canephora TaxID=49390 RepID=A0A068UFX2_COFCA|nr:unnamed protein product [Coffea canephora]